MLLFLHSPPHRCLRPSYVPSCARSPYHLARSLAPQALRMCMLWLGTPCCATALSSIVRRTMAISRAKRPYSSPKPPHRSRRLPSRPNLLGRPANYLRILHELTTRRPGGHRCEHAVCMAHGELACDRDAMRSSQWRLCASCSLEARTRCHRMSRGRAPPECSPRS